AHLPGGRRSSTSPTRRRASVRGPAGIAVHLRFRIAQRDRRAGESARNGNPGANRRTQNSAQKDHHALRWPSMGAVCNLCPGPRSWQTPRTRIATGRSRPREVLAMPRTDDPSLLSPDQRFREVARLLAVGLRRLLGPPAPPDPPPPRAAEKPVRNSPDWP